MATARNKDIYWVLDRVNDQMASKVGYYFQDPVISYRKEWSSLAWVFLFQSGREGVVMEGDELSEMQFREKPKSFCASCGGDPHVSTFDWLGRCRESVSKFWNRARKVYWHRYLKSKD